MICFPLDNTEYEAKALGAWFATRTRGILSADDHYAATTNGDMTVTIGPGVGWLKKEVYWGLCMLEENPTIFNIETADGELERIDTIVMQHDKNLNTGGLVYKKGGYGQQPPTPALPIRDNSDFDENVVWAIRVRAGATEIQETDLINLRLNEDYCGIVRDGITGIPTQALYDQYMAWYTQHQNDAQAFFSSYQKMVADRYAQYINGIAAHEQDAQQVYNSFELFMSALKVSSQADAQALLEDIRGILDEEAAGHLLNLIDALSVRVKRVEDTIFNDIDANQYLVLFDTLDNITATGVWNQELQRIEC